MGKVSLESVFIEVAEMAHDALFCRDKVLKHKLCVEMG